MRATRLVLLFPRRIYRVQHREHHLPHEVVILKGQAFPRCSSCNDSVQFELMHAAPNLYQPSARIIYELPVIADKELAA
jgi:hypothetical protein